MLAQARGSAAILYSLEVFVLYIPALVAITVRCRVFAFAAVLSFLVLRLGIAEGLVILICILSRRSHLYRLCSRLDRLMANCQLPFTLLLHGSTTFEYSL